MSPVPDLRIRVGNNADVNTSGEFVLYWMTAFRRTEWNFSLQRAVEWALKLKRPLLVFEALRCDYPWASDRLHSFVIQGMADNASSLAQTNVLFYPYLETEPGAGRGLLNSLSSRACVVVGDDFPCFFLPRMLESAALRIPVRFELVDSNGILPLMAADKVFSRAYDFRRFLQKNLLQHLAEFPQPNPLAEDSLPESPGLPSETLSRWPAAELLKDSELERFPIDHRVGATSAVGGTRAAREVLREFLETKLVRYESGRNQPEQDVTSLLSPYLHFGHISAHQVFSALVKHDGWAPMKISREARGKRLGWWGTSSAVEAFLDQLVTWRELGFNMCRRKRQHGRPQPDYDRYESLPEWARRTLAEHSSDRREYVYDLEQFQQAETHDPLWNAAQRQLLREGRIHNYLRMLWGKKILEWTASPEEALAIMIELNNKYALDGRDPNSYSGIFWCLGRYDRAWGPERPIFGKVRYMSSENTARKVRVRGYIDKYGP